MRDVLVDASGLIALLDRSDAGHDQCVEALKTIKDPLATVWPALTEAMQLLADTPPAPQALCEMAADGALTLLDLGASDLSRIKELMRKYRDLPMDFADACLVAVAERHGLARIVSLDRHFDTYALPRRTRFKVMPGRSR